MNTYIGNFIAKEFFMKNFLIKLVEGIKERRCVILQTFEYTIWKKKLIESIRIQSLYVVTYAECPNMWL